MWREVKDDERFSVLDFVRHRCNKDEWMCLSQSSSPPTFPCFLYMLCLHIIRYQTHTHIHTHTHKHTYTNTIQNNGTNHSKWTPTNSDARVLDASRCDCHTGSQATGYWPVYMKALQYCNTGKTGPGVGNILVQCFLSALDLSISRPKPPKWEKIRKLTSEGEKFILLPEEKCAWPQMRKL
jgi:hypothetical protein